MWDLLACRSCLAVNVKLEKVNEPLRRIYELITDLEFKTGDGFPNYFCYECYAQIKRTQAFRRRSRRAHFVMKEIVNLRKQVTFPDLMIVDRTKTNLKSSLGIWRLECNGLFTFTSEDLQESPIDKANPKALKQYKPKHLQDDYYATLMKTVCHLVDIVPDVDEEMIKDDGDDDDGRNKEVKEVNAIWEDDMQTDNGNNVPEDIDMDDVFKDLKEDEISDDDGLEPLDWNFSKKTAKERKNVRDTIDVDVPVKKVEIIGSMETSKLVSNVGVENVITILCNADIRFLSLVEQQEQFQLRLKAPSFVESTFKCAMCVISFPSMDTLRTHVAEHNAVTGKYLCGVCQNRYTMAHSLLVHCTEVHWYQYTCKSCKQSSYSLEEIINHNLDFEKVEIGCKVTKNHAKEARRRFVTVPMDQKQMKEVMSHKRPRNKYCLKCKQSFPSNMALSLHEQMHYRKNESNAKCDLCKIYTTKELLEEHMLKWHSYRYECKYCRNVCYNRPEAIHHYRKHTIHTCCRIRFKKMSAYLLHVRYKHGLGYTKRIHCNICGYATAAIHLLYRHQLQLHKYISVPDPRMGREEFSCRECDLNFVNQKALNTHMLVMSHEGAENIELGCVKCKKVYDTKEEFDNHYEMCTVSSKHGRECSYCDEVFPGYPFYKKHLMREHPNLPYLFSESLMCEACGQIVKKLKGLDGHKAVCPGNKDAIERHSCDYCGTVRTTQSELVVHIISMHTIRPYHCALCKRRFKTRSICKDHILKMHKPIMLYKCEYCDQSFPHFDFLATHSDESHNVKMEKPPIKYRERSKVFFYPHMKIDAGLIDRTALEKCDIVLCDYYDEKYKPISCSDEYFLFNTDNRVRKIKGKSVKVKRSDSDVKTGNKPKISNDRVESDRLIKNEAMDIDKIEDVIEKVKTNINMQVSDFDLRLNVEEGLQVVEEEGNQYIYVNDVLFKVENIVES